jgi:hypothetical protein
MIWTGVGFVGLPVLLSAIKYVISLPLYIRLWRAKRRLRRMLNA